MEHKFTKTTGNFKYTVSFMTGDVSPLEAYLIEQGIVRELQGAVLAGWEKAVAYPGEKQKRKDMPDVIDAVTGEKRPWSRNDIEFSRAAADELIKRIGELKIDIGKEDEKGNHVKNVVDAGIVDVEVEEYTGPEKAVPKFKAEKDFVRLYLFEADGKTSRLLKSGEPRSLESFCANKGLELPSEPWEEDASFLASVKAWKAAKDAELAAGE